MIGQAGATAATANIPPEVVTALAAAVSASAIAIDPSGQHLAAINPDSGSISLVDGLGQGIPGASREVRVGADPRTLSFTPDGAQVLVADYGSGTLTFVSVATGQAEAQINVGSRPYGIVAGTTRATSAWPGVLRSSCLTLRRETSWRACPWPIFPLAWPWRAIRPACTSPTSTRARSP